MITHIKYTVSRIYSYEINQWQELPKPYEVDIYLQTDDRNGNYLGLVGVVVNGVRDKETSAIVRSELQDLISEEWSELRQKLTLELVPGTIEDTESYDWFIGDDGRQHWIAKCVAEFIWVGDPTIEREAVQRRRLMNLLGGM